jgi:tRNA(adenine34) deaminase
MEQAIALADEAAVAGEVPIGALVVRPDEPDPDRTVVAARRNERESSHDPTAHAEVLALRDAATRLGRWRLDDCLLVVTLEPCPMCAGAAWAARISGVVQGAANSDAGALGTLYHLGQDPRLNHEFGVRHGILADRCGEVLRNFFADRR